MKLFITKLGLFTTCILVLCSFYFFKAPAQVAGHQGSTDSTNFIGQPQIDSIEKVLLEFAEKEYELFQTTSLLKELQDSSSALNFKMTTVKAAKRALLKSFKASKDTSESSYAAFETDFVNLYKSQSQCSESINTISNKQIPEQQKALANYSQSCEDLKSNRYKKAGEFLLQNLKATKNGAGARYFFEKRCRFFIADDSYSIKIHHNSGKPVALESIINAEKIKPDMVTNAGMFQPSFKPQGLLIENGLEISPIDSFKRNDDNFHMLPNAIFFIDSCNQYHIVETKEFVKQNIAKEKAKAPKFVKYATQSGPMLVNGGIIHKKFTLSSKNLNIRSGVGVMKDGRVVFIISDDPINFYQFSLIFRDLFQCKDALYLDGAISKMYTKDQALYATKKFNNDSGGSFGPMISVTSKK